MNAYVNTPAIVETGNPVVFTGLNSISRGNWSYNGGWLSAPQATGRFTLKKPGKYLVVFSAQVTGVATTPAELTLEVDGIPYPGAVMSQTVAAATDFAQIGTMVEVSVGCGEEASIAIVNTGESEITINSASLVIVRIG